MAGRPSRYNKELATEICHRIAQGESLRTICKSDGMPSKSTVLLWVVCGDHPEFEEQYDLARRVQAETLADEIFDIADDGSNDWMDRKGDDGKPAGYVLNGEHVQRSRVRLDTRKWYLSKVLPKYAEKSRHELTGADGGPVQTDTTWRVEVVGKD